MLTREDFDKIIAIKERSCDYYFVLPETDFFSGSDDNMYTEDYEEDAKADLKFLLNSIIGNIKDPSLVGNQVLSETLEMMEEIDHIFEDKENLEQFLQ